MIQTSNFRFYILEFKFTDEMHSITPKLKLDILRANIEGSWLTLHIFGRSSLMTIDCGRRIESCGLTPGGSFIQYNRRWWGGRAPSCQNWHGISCHINRCYHELNARLIEKLHTQICTEMSRVWWEKEKMIALQRATQSSLRFKLSFFFPRFVFSFAFFQVRWEIEQIFNELNLIRESISIHQSSLNLSSKF